MGNGVFWARTEIPQCSVPWCGGPSQTVGFSLLTSPKFSSTPMLSSHSLIFQHMPAPCISHSSSVALCLRQAGLGATGHFAVLFPESLTLSFE